MSSVLLLGATGLVGKAALQELLASGHWDQVRVLARRPAPFAHPRLQWVEHDLRPETPLPDSFLAVDCALCCLGTTLRDAGSRAAFRAVDHDLIVRLARAIRAAGTPDWLMVSSSNASANSMFFYPRVKAETEAAVRALAWSSLVLARPSLLLGERSQRRTGEAVAGRLMGAIEPLLGARTPSWRAIKADCVGQALAVAAARRQPGEDILYYRQLTELAACSVTK